MYILIIQGKEAGGMFFNLNKIFCIVVILMFFSIGINVIGAKPVGDNGRVMGVSRHPDPVHDSEGRLHMVWQEPIGGQYEIFYSMQGDEKEMGLGADKTPVVRITNTDTDSIWPQIAIDPSSAVIYIFWTEQLPTTTWDTAEPANALEPAIFYTASLPDPDNNEMTWTEPMNLADGANKAVDVKVVESQYVINTPGAKYKTMKGEMDTDGDGISDSDEILAKNGFVSGWLSPDSDFDGLEDLQELELGFDPTLDERTTQLADVFLEAYFRHSDTDGDGFTFAEETEETYPVTVGVAVYGEDGLDGRATYIIWPRATFTGYVELGLQIARTPFLSPPFYNAGYKVTVRNTVRTDETETVSITGTEPEFDRFTIKAGPFHFEKGIFTKLWVKIEVDQPSGKSDTAPAYSSAPPSVMGERKVILWSLIITDPADDTVFENFEPNYYSNTGPVRVSRTFDQFKISPDPDRPDMFLEIDTMDTHHPTYETMNEVIRAFSDHGIILHYKFDEVGLAVSEPTGPDTHRDGARTLEAIDEMRNYLHKHDNPLYDKYVHVMFVHYLYSGDVGYPLGGCISASTADDKSHSGVLLADEVLIDTASYLLDVWEVRVKVLVHELGHVLGSAHETDEGVYDLRVDGPGGMDTDNVYNVMRQGGYTGTYAGKAYGGSGNDDENLGATSRASGPRFSIESYEQFHLTEKVSVECGRRSFASPIV